MEPGARRLGVEEELLLVDPDDGRPLGLSGAVRDTGEAGDELDGEMRAEQVETGSTPHHEADALAADLVARRRTALDAAGTQGAVVAGLATSPVAPDPLAPPPGRYGRILERFGPIASEQLTNGQHVHVEIASREEGVGVLDRIGPWLPVLRALSANSPFWRDDDTNHASYRSLVWNRWPSAGPTPVFGSPAAYDATVAAMIATGTVLDEGMVYFDARLAASFPTVEVRVADVAGEVEEAVVVALLARALVDTAARAWAAGEPAPSSPVEALRLAHWRAARSGCVPGHDAEAGVLVDPRTGRASGADTVVAALLEHVDTALGADRERVREGCARVLAGGTGAAHQRRVFADAGGHAGDGVRAVALDAAARCAPR
ncbi:glutamate--cysteine ligase [Actinomycetospora endophytica]|uniref:Putative glutamate--cysteine ligase 2 n=1 Tax=Actinomycetospora endophytica TaxID=2291215 RepID=A0ABS8PCB0_9PSEU|nr:glutamate--cysteine ligase [Actinomycetospora endophytica]MCD2195902.1 glutamate--cysteine ligase [Actinomycetospora endophytica]